MLFKKFAVVGVVVSVLAASVVPVLAQEGPGGPGQPNRPFAGQTFGPGMHFQERPVWALIETALDAAAAETGLSVQEIAERVRGGESLAEVIAAEGGDVEVVIDAIVGEATARIDTAVVDGRLTQERADQMLANLEDGVTRAVNGEWRPFMRGRLQQGVQRLATVGVVRLAAEETGMTPLEIRDELLDGATLAAILSENGVDVNAFVGEALGLFEARLETAVTNGRLTQERADSLLEQFQTHLETRINTPIATVDLSM